MVTILGQNWRTTSLFGTLEFQNRLCTMLMGLIDAGLIMLHHVKIW